MLRRNTRDVEKDKQRSFLLNYLVTDEPRSVPWPCRASPPATDQLAPSDQGDSYADRAIDSINTLDRLVDLVRPSCLSWWC